MKKKIVLSIAAVSFVALYLLCDLPIIISANQKEVVTLKDTSAIIFNPLTSADLSVGNNIAFLLIDKSDRAELPSSMRKCKLYRCTSNPILQSLKNSFYFAKVGGDMVTCQSRMLIYKDNKLIFHSGILITDSIVGMQNSTVGWAESTKNKRLKEILTKFQPVDKLVIRF